ncbi:hypothetical protein P692DRAFT_20881080 [Suillus brevipes Sb2]|nr:hypothetical protein P692DRAFT_20881080 [Suillus brevipes Sb2]
MVQLECVHVTVFEVEVRPHAKEALISTTEPLVSVASLPTVDSLTKDLIQLQEHLEDNILCYILARLDDPSSEWLAISYVSDFVNIQNKNSLTKSLGLAVFTDTLFVTLKVDLTPEAYRAHKRYQAAPKPLSVWEQEMANIKAAEREAGNSYEGSNARKNYIGQRELTVNSIKLLVFANLALEQTHLVVWYARKFTPFHDLSMRVEIKTIMPLMLSESAAGAQCAVDRLAAYYKSILDFINDPLHKVSMEARFLDLHERGLKVLHDFLGLSSPSHTIYVPMTLEEIVKPLLQSSLSAHMQMPVQEGSQYLTGHHMGSNFSSMALYSGSGFLIDDELEYEPDKNLQPDTILNQGIFGLL